MRTIRIVVGFLFTILICEVNLVAQQRRCLLVDSYPKIDLLDSMLIDPESIEITPDVPFKYIPHLQQIELASKSQQALNVCYQVLPLNLTKTYFHKSKELYDSSAAFKPAFVKGDRLQDDRLIAIPNIYTVGSLTRGVSFGNAQSLNVISSFNFQMDGQLTENLKIRADITDQNVPFQPEGNTQQIREFDNVTFEIYNDNLSLKAGDVVLQNEPSNFMRYYKNVLGGAFDVHYQIGDKKTGSSSLAISAAKGQFVDITIEAEEGQQGPYQLHGPEGQSFVIVMANSEKVYLDGRLLKRGYNHDYTIDYNLGELTFNPNVLITQFSRIRVTFEYSDQNYSRSIIAANQSISMGATQLNLSFYREKDDVNRPQSFLLSNEDKLLMSLVGDDDIPVPIPSDVLTQFDQDLVLYVRKDTIDGDGRLQSIFEFSRDSTQALFQVSFTQVDFGQGDYVLVDNDVNGRVYEWTSPIAGISQGDFAPIKFVPAPNQKQLITIGGKHEISDHLHVYTEVAFSNQDLNLYSDIDQDDNVDLAYKVGIALEDQPVSLFPDYRLSLYANYEFDGENFQPIDRYRAIEFDRNWSYDAASDTVNAKDHIFHSGVRLQQNPENLIDSRYSVRRRDNAIDGYQHEHMIKKTIGPLSVQGELFSMENQSLTEFSEWKRWSAETFLERFALVPGYRVEEDRNRVSAYNSDSLTRTAMNFMSHQVYLRNHDTLKTSFRISHILRSDQTVAEGRMIPFTQSATTSLLLATPRDRSHALDLTLTYRDLKYEDEFSELNDERFILGRILARNSFLNRHVTSDLNYATSSSQEILREYVYVEVTPGEGTHTWRDLNEDGIQDLTEFFEALNFDERNYIRIFVPTTESVEAFNTIFVFSLRTQMPRSWRGRAGLLEVLSRLSNRTNVNINKKNTNGSFQDRFNPIALHVDDDELIFARDAIRSTFFFNRTGRGFGADYTFSVSRNKQLISRGVDSRFDRDELLNLRYYLNSAWSVTSKLGRFEKRNKSEFQEDRNYEIIGEQLGPGLVWQPNNNWRFSTFYNFMRKENVDAETDESSKIQSLTFENRWASKTRNSLSTQFSYTAIDFDGDENTSAAYELLNALRPGENYYWQINYNQKLISGLQINLSYEGRKSGDQAVIHMGRAQVTALF